MCVKPLLAWQCANSDVVFVSNLKRHDIVRELQLPCGQCIECRLERSRQWAMRCMHEAKMHKDNCFLTLTYKPECLPERGQLVYSDFQKFMKRFRKRFGKCKYYMCGEYGDENWRPHFHACVFGVDLPDKRPFKTTQSGEVLYRSDILDKLWPYGIASVGSVTFQSAAYVARYCVQKRTGKEADSYYARVDENGRYQLEPEFNHMSLKPAIGSAFLEKYWADVFPHDYVVVNGSPCKVPKYYVKLLERKCAELPDGDEKAYVLERIQYLRYLRGLKRAEDNLPHRLEAREQVVQARSSMLIRRMDDYGS